MADSSAPKDAKGRARCSTSRCPRLSNPLRISGRAPDACRSPASKALGVLVVATHDPLLLARPVAFLAGFALVVRLLALGQRYLGLDLVALPIEGGDHHGVAVALDAADQAVDLATVQEQLARAPVLGDDVGGR